MENAQLSDERLLASLEAKLAPNPQQAAFFKAREAMTAARNALRTADPRNTSHFRLLRNRYATAWSHYEKAVREAGLTLTPAEIARGEGFKSVALTVQGFFESERS